MNEIDLKVMNQTILQIEKKNTFLIASTRHLYFQLQKKTSYFTSNIKTKKNILYHIKPFKFISQYFKFAQIDISFQKKKKKEL